MSWEECKRECRSCPCGNGHYTVINRSDDWGRSEENRIMECSRCAATHGLYTYYQQPKGVSEIHYLWVSKQLLDELASLNKHNEWEREQFQTYFLERYGSTWHNHFAGKRKKRSGESSRKMATPIPVFLPFTRRSTFRASIRFSIGTFVTMSPQQ